MHVRLHPHTSAGTVVERCVVHHLRRWVHRGFALRRATKPTHGRAGRDRTADCARHYASISPAGGRSVRPSPLSTLRSTSDPCLPSELERLLLDVVADGFVLYCCGPIAAPWALVASYQWESCVDLVTIRCLDHVTTSRVPAPRHGPGDVFAPEVVVWAYEGSPRWALRALLDLVPPQHPDAPTSAYPAPPSLYIPPAERRPMTIRLPSPGRAGMRAVRLAERWRLTGSHDHISASTGA